MAKFCPRRCWMTPYMNSSYVYMMRHYAFEIGNVRSSWKFVDCLQSSILHPKNIKFGESDIFKSLEIA